MNAVFGSVIVSETGRGIPGLTVGAFDVGAAALAQDAWVRLASSITDDEGKFRLEYSSNGRGDGAVSHGVELLLTVSGPEETAGSREPLFVAPAVRRNASASEAYQVRIPVADLEKAGLGAPGDAKDGAAEPPARMRERLVARVARDVAVAGAEHEARTLHVASAREELARFGKEIRPALAERLSAVGSERVASDTFVRAGASVRDVQGRVLDADLTAVISRGGSRPRAVARFALTDEQAQSVRERLDGESTIEAEELSALLSGAAGAGGPGYERVDPAEQVRRTPSAREEQARRTLAGNGVPGAPVPAPADAPGSGVDLLKTDDVPRFLARLVDTMTSPEEAVLAGLEPRATQERLTRSVRDLAFEPSPADTPAFYDFHNLQVAFRHVWQEAIDEGVLDLAEDAYNEIVLAGGQPSSPGVVVDPVLGLRREAAAVGLALRRGATGALAAAGPASKHAGFHVRPGLLDGLLTALPAEPVDGERVPGLLAELEQRLQEPYAFTTFAANKKERSVNFGILVTYRQRWEPTAYQAGRLAKTITLAPKEVQKYTRTVKRQRKRAEREVENHLRMRKEETSVTSRAEEEIVRKANAKTNFHLSS